MKKFILLLCVVFLCACTNKPAQLNDGIQTGSLAEVGFDPKRIEQLLNKDYKELHSLLVYKDGLLVLEKYFKGNDDYIEFENNIFRNKSRPHVQWSVDKKHYVASVNKALTATLTGIAFDKFDIPLRTKLSALLPQYRKYFQTPNKAKITIKDLLTMRMGFDWDEWGRDDLALLWQSDDFGKYLLSRANNGPGKAWKYNSAGPNLLLKGLQNVVKQPLRTWADQHFYSKLGITDFTWQSQPDGDPEGSARMFMRPRDMLKVGITYLNKGKWQDEQVIPAKWVEAVSTVQATSEAGDYSYLFWLRELNGIRYISADGDGGQYINIFPEQNMVIVMTGGNYLEWPVYSKQAQEIMADIFAGLRRSLAI
ncbi:MAG: serine hydrolase [Algicola sp.]|nr:serine hydrolase [Algicola sp.]